MEYGEALVEQVGELAPEVSMSCSTLWAAVRWISPMGCWQTPGGWAPSRTARAPQPAGGACVFVRPSSAGLAELAGLIDAGQLSVDVAGTYPLDQAVAAYERLQEGHVRGKLVLVP